jgi:enoyl-CoA hydratase/carnithine racemase
MITADEALAWDMVSELVPPEKLRAHVQAYADDLASKSPAALAAIRRTITLGGGMDYEAGLAFEKEAVGQVEVASGPDFHEGVDAFLAKRPPRWHFGS